MLVSSSNSTSNNNNNNASNNSPRTQHLGDPRLQMSTQISWASPPAPPPPPHQTLPRDQNNHPLPPSSNTDVPARSTQSIPQPHQFPPQLPPPHSHSKALSQPIHNKPRHGAFQKGKRSFSLQTDPAYRPSIANMPHTQWMPGYPPPPPPPTIPPGYPVLPLRCRYGLEYIVYNST